MASQEHSHVGDAADVSQNAEAAHYVVTAHPPGGVLLSTKCNFTGPDSTDVIMAKSQRLEIRHLSSGKEATDTGSTTALGTSFSQVLSVPVNGRITALLPINIPRSPTALLFILTDRLQFAVVGYNLAAAGTHNNPYPLQTHASGVLREYGRSTGGREAECGPLVAVDHWNRCIAMHMFDGMVTVLPINQYYDPTTQIDGAAALKQGIAKRGHNSVTPPALGEPFHVRIEERTLLSLCFLHAPMALLPQLALLHQDSRGMQHVISHSVDMRKKDLILYSNISKTAGGVPSPSQRLKKSRVDGGSGFIIPVPPPPSPSAAAASASASASSSSAAPKSLSFSHMMGGVLILGQRQITYHNTAAGVTKVLPISPSLLLTCCLVEDENDSMGAIPGGGANVRFLIGDETGRIHVVLLMSSSEGGGNAPMSLHLDTLGQASISSSLTYLPGGMIFVGSQFGDSQLLRILDEPIPIVGDSQASEDQRLASGMEFGESTFLSVLDEYVNLGPIVDFDLVPTAHSPPSSASGSDSSSAIAAAAAAQGSGLQHRQSQVVTASGSSTNGSIRLIRNGIGMNECASVDIPGIKNMWGLRRKWADNDDGYLVQSFVGETRILGVTEEEEEEELESEEDEEEGGGTLEEVMIPGFDSTSSTLFVGNIAEGDLLVQITEREIRLVNCVTLQCVSTWSPTDLDPDNIGAMITVASGNEFGQLVIALRGGMVLYFKVEDATGLTFVEKNMMEREVSCIDLNPLRSNVTSDNASSDAMDIDEPSKIRCAPVKSEVAAIGLWDDFTVRILSVHQSMPLKELLRVHLGSSDENEETGDDGGNAESRRSQNMMARSVCLITLDSTSSNVGEAASKSTGVDMLLVGLGDGTLVSYAIVVTVDKALTPPCQVLIHSRKEVSLGTQTINLIPLQTAQTNNLYGSTCVLATGDRPTVVYLAGGSGSVQKRSNPKLCYSNVNLSTSDDEEDEESGVSLARQQRVIAVNVATSFSSPLLFSSSSALTEDGQPQTAASHYSLCVSDDATLRLGVIDDIQKLHVTTFKLGMAPRRIVHCSDSKMYAVGCIAAEKVESKIQEGEANMGNCVRFFDESTFEEIDRIDLEPFEMILSMVSTNLRVSPTNPARGVTDTETDSTKMSGSDSSLSGFKQYLLVGTAYAYPDEDEPSNGRILVISCSNSNGSDNATHTAKDTNHGGMHSRFVRRVTEMQVHGGVYSICAFYGGTILATINSKTQLCMLVESASNSDIPELKFVGTGHHGHILSTIVRCMGGQGRSLLDTKDINMSRTPDTKGKSHAQGEKEMIAIVGDLMRSISVVKYYPKHQVLEEVARDYNANWTTAVDMLTDNIYLGAEHWNNLFVVKRNPNAKSEEVRCRLDTVGEFHLGEMCNKFMGGSLVMPSSSGAGSTGECSSVLKNNSGGGQSSSSSPRTRRAVVTIGSQTLYATVDGTLGSIIGLDSPTAAFFSTLERAMARTVRPVGDLSHKEFRAFEADRRAHPSRGFVDGDLVESFLDLDRAIMEAVVSEMNHDGGWEIEEQVLPGRSGSVPGIDDDGDMMTSGRSLSVDDVLAMVEEMSMLH